MSSQVIWLEPEHFEEATEMSNSELDESRQWKNYLNALALSGFEDWLRERVPTLKFNRDNSRVLKSDTPNRVEVISNLTFEGFKIGLIPVDCLVDDFINLPEEALNSPKDAAHFYVLIEVREEEEQLNLYGFLRYDQLVRDGQPIKLEGQSNHCYQIPLSKFDQNINNLLLYSRFLEKNAISLPPVFEANDTVGESLTPTPRSIANTIINLSQWWGGIVEEGWQSTDNIWNAVSLNYAWGSVRSRNPSNHYSVSRTKIFDFGLLLNDQSLALVVNLKPGENDEIDVLAQVIPYNEKYLPFGLKLKVTLNFDTYESESQEVTARKADHTIQLEFCEVPGKKFKVEVSFMDAVVTEEFVLGVP
ncbi:DUF1822 family protein [Capilliphycus salinus ALCB114379]|uniref:DUF1822 family protein n=1 Tax=Capilliphycus salinus TaxID=2768948 RepID=UPI0039A67EF3